MKALFREKASKQKEKRKYLVSRYLWTQLCIYSSSSQDSVLFHIMMNLTVDSHYFFSYICPIPAYCAEGMCSNKAACVVMAVINAGCV